MGFAVQLLDEYLQIVIQDFQYKILLASVESGVIFRFSMMKLISECTKDF